MVSSDPRRRSAASLVLARCGVRVRDVAQALELSDSAVSLQLAGRRQIHPSLIAVVRALAGPEAAHEVERLLNRSARR